MKNQTELTKNKKSAHFAERLNFYKITWIYIIGSVLGFLWETIWCLCRYGRYEWRSGMAFTPFNPVYGLGAVTLYLCLYKINKRNPFAIFIVGTIAGTAVELACSYFQEAAFGSMSWDYSDSFMNFEGRICLGISLGWGALSLAWAWIFCPLLEKGISLIPNKAGKILTWVLIAIILIDAIITVSAMIRWIIRKKGVEATGIISKILDKFFPDERMEFMYPRIKFV